MSLILNSYQCTLSLIILLQIKLKMFNDCVLMRGRGQMSMLCTLIRGQMSNTFFQLGGKCPPLSITWGDRCPHIPFFIGGQMSEGANVLHSFFANSC